MSGSLQLLRAGRAGTTRRVTWRTVLGLVLVPLTVAGVLLWGLWNPEERLETVTAAVVNLDEPVEVDGQTVPLGRVLAAELIDGGSDDEAESGDADGDAGVGASGDLASGGGSEDDAEDDGSRTNFDWVLTDADDAAAGLDDGRYASVVTIPENFSSAATSLSDGPESAERANIDVATSDRGRLLDPALSGIVTQTATTVLNQQLGSQFVGNIFVGMTELQSGISDAADGADQLADGGKQLATGTKQLADGTTELQAGTEQLASGAGELANGTGELSTGASGLSSGASDLSTGAASLSTGVSRYVDGASQLSQSYDSLEQGTIAAATQLKALAGALGQLQANVAVPQENLQNGLSAVQTGTEGLAGDIATLAEQCGASGATEEFCADMTTTLQNRAGEIGGGAATAGTGAAGLGQALQALQDAAASGGGSGGDPAAELDALIAGATEFGSGLDTLAEQGSALTSGASQLAGGASQLSSGASELAGGASQLAGGASQLSAGTSELAASTPELAQGASQLADGAKRSQQGAGSLARGLHEATDEIPAYSESERDRMSELAVEPVETTGSGDELFNAAGAPLFAGIALWAGALATFLLLAPLWSRTREAARGVAAITLRSALPAVAIGGAQGLIAGVVIPGLLGYDLGQGAAFIGLAVLAGAVFGLLVQGLSALLHGFGRFIAFALLVIVFAVGVVATVPTPLQAIGDASPVGAVLSGFQAIAVGTTGAGAAAAALMLWGAAGLVLTGFAVARARRQAG
ncbi:YhgE/Pip domain-containing protein [Leucobacter sp. GX24907]